MTEIPKEILDYGGSAAVLIWATALAWARIAEKIKRNGNGQKHLDAQDRGIMLQAVARSTEEMKEKIGAIATTQAVQTETLRGLGFQIGRIENGQGEVWQKFNEHDHRIREVEIKSGRK